MGTLAAIAAIAGVCFLFSPNGSDSQSTNATNVAALNASARNRHPSEADVSKTAASTNPPAAQHPIEKRDLAAEAAQREEAERRERSRNENIYDAAKYGDIDRIKELLAVVPDQANARNSAQRTPLFECKNARVAELLISAGADVNAQDISQETALMNAAVHCNIDVAETLIAHGANVNVTTNTSQTAILSVRMLPNIDPVARKAMYRLLVKHGANINDISLTGHTLLNDAARDNDLDAVKFFVELGALNQVPGVAHSAYQEAVLAGAHDTAQFLKNR
jgi:uncharacterized protein